MNNAKILVTGGSGFIGSEVVAKLLKSGATVANLDFKPPTRPEHKPYWHDCDIRDAEGVRRVMAAVNPHYVLHLASDIDVSLTRLEQFTSTIDGTRIIVEALQTLTNLKRFVHISTQLVVSPGIRPKGETDFHPHTLYGEAKARSEALVRASSLQDWVILRPTIIWGPRHPSFAKAIWKYLANGRYLHPSKATPVRKCYGYLPNTADQMIAMLDADLSKTPSRVFYLGDEVINQDLWVDGFATAFTGKPAKRVPAEFLWLLGATGEILKSLGIRFPMDKGRYFRMTTPAEIALEPTFEIIGHPAIPMAQGIQETVAWLEQVKPELFRKHIKAVLPVPSRAATQPAPQEPHK